MNLLLIYPNVPAVATQPPLGLMYIASTIRAKTSDQVKIIEGNAASVIQQWQQIPGPERPEKVLITCMTSMYHEIIQMRDYFYSVGVPVVFGGVHASIMPETFLVNSASNTIREKNLVVVGEGEKTIIKILNGEFDDSQERIIQGETVENLDELPFPARDLINPRYLNHSVSLLASRGCPYNCAFCQPGLRKVFGPKVRRRSVENVIQEILKVHDRYGVREFEFFDDTFTADPLWIHEFDSHMVNLHLWDKIHWRALSRTNMVTFDMLKEMKEAGLTKLSLGIESGSQEILNAYSKGTTVEQNDEVLKWCKELKIKVHGFFMIGALEETLETIEATRKFIRAHEFDTIFVTVTTPTPGSRLYARALEEGRLKVPWQQFDLLGSLTTTVHPKSIERVVPMELYYLSAEDVLKARYSILREFYKRKLRNPYYLIDFLRNNSLGYAWEAALNVFR